MNITLDDMTLLFRALKFAADKHQHQRRKNSQASPYINHLIEVAEVLWEIGRVRDLETIIAGILHDTIEDTTTTAEELECTFNRKIREIVEDVTDDKQLPKQIRKQLQIEHAGQASFEGRQVKLADKICNIRDLLKAPPVDWSLQRQLEYLEWGEQVIDRLRGTNSRLERHFDTICRDVRDALFT